MKLADNYFNSSNKTACTKAMNAFDEHHHLRFQKRIKFNSFSWLLTDRRRSKIIKTMPKRKIGVSCRSVPAYKEVKILTKSAP